MTIPVQQSLAGFIAKDANVSFSDAGTMQVRFRIGVEHWRREQDGTFSKLENSFHDMLIFGKTAERAADRFHKGDQFVAHGYIDTRYAEPPAGPAKREVYVARKIGHDLARTAYDVDRTPGIARQASQQLEQAAVGMENGQPSAGAGPVVAQSPPRADHHSPPRPDAAPGHGIGL